MCPIFRIGPREEASPRSKANLVRAVLTGQLPATHLEKAELKEVADLCVNCHQCRNECPANVNIPKLMVETKAQFVAMNGLSLTDWCLSRMDKIAGWASLFSSIVNWTLANRRTRWLLEKMFGIAQGRKLPQLEARSFMRQARRKRWTRHSRQTGRSVIYFVDLYANWFDVQLGERGCESTGTQRNFRLRASWANCSAEMARITMGDIERARPTVRHNVSLLADAVRQGYHIVTSEPAAALCLTQEYPNILNEDDTRLVAANTSDVCAYLWQLHQSGKLELDLSPINATLGYHLPCHSRAMTPEGPAEQLLRLIPGLSVQRVEQGCSGMAGTFGVKRENYRASLRAGLGLISALRSPTIHAGTTECSACKIQMEQGTTKPTIHPLKMLALAYGLMPEIDALLSKRGEDLVVT